MSKVKKYLELLKKGKNGDLASLLELEKLLEEDLTQELIGIQSKTKLKKYKLVKKIVEKTNKTAKSMFHGVRWDDIRNVSVFSNGCFMIELNERFETLEKENALDLDYKDLLDFRKAKDQAEINIDELLPEIVLKAAQKKPDDKIIKFKIKDVLYGFNAEYLNHAIQLLELKGVVKVRCILDSNRNPILFENKIGRALVLPVRISEKNENN